MTPKSLIVLAAVTAVAVGAAVMVAHTGSAGSAIADRGRVLVPDLMTKANAVASIVVTAGKTKTTLNRSADGFVDSTGYPANTDIVRTLVTSLATLTVAEGKTDRPDRYADLNLADPGADKGAAVEIGLKTADGGVVADVFTGAKDLSVGGSRGGQYVRLAGETKSFLVRGQVEVPADRAGWFDSELCDIKPGELKAATLTNHAGVSLSFVKGTTGENLMFATPVEGKTPDEPKFTKLTYMFKAFDFIDVRKAAAEAPAGAASFKAETVDGLVVTMTEVAGADSADKGWVRITAATTDAKAEAAAKAVIAKTDGYEFQIKPNYVDIFGWGVDDMVKAPAS